MAIEAHTIANRLTLIIILVILGLTQGMQPIIGYNLGANKIKRVISTTNYAIKTGLCIGLTGSILGFFFADIIVGMFKLSPELSILSGKALNIITIMLPLSGFQMVVSGLFQSTGMPFKATALSLARQFIFLLPLIYILPLLYSMDGVWMAIPISDFISSILVFFLYILQLKTWNKTLTAEFADN